MPCYMLRCMLVWFLKKKKKCMLVCVCVSIDASVEHAFNKVKT